MSDYEDDNGDETECCRNDTMESIRNGFGLCEKRSECINKTVEVGIQCKKLHIAVNEYNEMREEINKEKEKEVSAKKLEAKTQYCKHYMYGTCRFNKNCWKRHVSLRVFKKTIRCKFHETIGCRNGKMCEYKHLLNPICKYFLQGNCYNEDMCVFRHMKPDETDNKNTKQNTNEEQETNNENEDNPEIILPVEQRKEDESKNSTAKIMEPNKSQELIKIVNEIEEEKIQALVNLISEIRKTA